MPPTAPSDSSDGESRRPCWLLFAKIFVDRIEIIRHDRVGGVGAAAESSSSKLIARPFLPGFSDVMGHSMCDKLKRLPSAKGRF